MAAMQVVVGLVLIISAFAWEIEVTLFMRLVFVYLEKFVSKTFGFTFRV